MKSDIKRKNQELAGIPDSKPFTAEESERLPNAEERILNCHIGGVLIRDLNLEPHVVAALDYWATDEGREERNARPEMREPSGIRLGAGPFEKALEQRKDDVQDRDFELWDARDPLKEVADRYAVPGMAPKFMSASKISQNRGTGDYVVVKDAAGDPVTVKGMVLGHMPAGRAKARNRHYREKGTTLLKQLDAKYKAEGGPTAVSDQS